MHRLKTILIFLTIIMSMGNIHAIDLDVFDLLGNRKRQREETASEMMNSLINDGTLIQKEEISLFSQLIGATADLTLNSIYKSILPGINRITGSSEKSLPDGQSIMGRLISLLITLECIVLAIENMLSGEPGGALKIAGRIINIILLLAFLSYLPAISTAILNLFAKIGIVMSGGSSVITDSHPFAFMPSDVLQSLDVCRTLLDIEKVRIGGYTLSTIIPHLVIIIGEFLVTIPFICLVLMVMFWYSEMFLIMLSAYISLPLAIFSKAGLTDSKSILKAFLIQGIKICFGVFLANLINSIIRNALEQIGGSFASTIHAVLFCLFITITLYFIIRKGPDIITSALSGQESKSSSLFAAGLLGGSIAAAGSAILQNLPRFISPRTANPTVASPGTDRIPDPIPEKNNPVPNTGHKDDIQTISKPAGKSYPANYGEVTARVTPRRMEAAKLELKKDGINNPTENQLMEKARNDAIIQKLLKMEKQGFLLADGTYNKPAAEQLKRMRENNG